MRVNVMTDNIMNDLFAEPAFSIIIFVFFIIFYIIFSIKSIKNIEKYKPSSIIMCIIGVLCIIGSCIVANARVEKYAGDLVYNEYKRYATREWIDDIYSGKYTAEESEEMLDKTHTAFDLHAESSYALSIGSCRTFAKNHPYYISEAEKEIKGFSYYYILGCYIFYGVLFFVLMIPVKIAHKNNHPAKNSIGVITVLFGNTIIIWIAMLIWANSPSSAAKQQNIDTSDKLKKLNEMLSEGLITKQEFDAKKKDLLDKM